VINSLFFSVKHQTVPGQRPARPEGAERASRSGRVALAPQPLDAVVRRAIFGTAADRDLPRFHRLGNLALERDRQQAIVEPRIFDDDKVGELEGALESARRNPAVEIALAGGVAALVIAFAAGNGQQVVLRDDLDLVAREAGECE